MYEQDSFIFGGNTGLSQQELQRRKAIQALLGGGSFKPVNSIGEGIGSALSSIADGIDKYRIDKQESAARQQAQKDEMGLFGSFSRPSGSGDNNPILSQAQSQQTDQPTSELGIDVAKRLSQDFGLTPAAAAGFAGNLAHESGDFKTLQEISPLVPGSRGGYGWAQWTGPRRVGFEDYAKRNNLDPASPEANYGYLSHELRNTPEGGVLDKLRGVNDPAKAAQIVSDTFLRPGIPHMESRIARTNAIAQSLGVGQPVQVADASGNIPAGSYLQSRSANVPAPQAPQQYEQASPQMDMGRIRAASSVLNNPFASPAGKAMATEMLKQEYAKGDPAKQADISFKKAQTLNQLTPKVETFYMPDGSPYQGYIDPMTKTPVRIGAGKPDESRANNAYDQATGAAYAKTFNELQDKGRNAPAALGNLALMRKTLDDPNFYSGAGGETVVPTLKRLAQTFGADPNNVSSTEAFSSLSKQAVLNKVGGSLGTAISNSDRDYINQQLPNLDFSREGNRKIVDIMERVHKREADVARMARDYAKRNNGRIDAGFDDELQNYAEKTPLFKDIIGGDAAQAKPQMQPQQMPQAPKVGSVDGGYEFIGGNPADPKSWRKM